MPKKKYFSEEERREAKKKSKKKYLSDPKNKKKHSEYNKKYNKSYYIDYDWKKYRSENKEHRKKYEQEYRDKNPELKNYKKDWIEKNRDIYEGYFKSTEGKKKRNKYQKSRKNSDPLFKLMSYIRSRANIALKRKRLTKKSSTLKVLGCTQTELKKHIEKLFKSGMNWKNHGTNGWHLDHIVPLAKAKTVEELERLGHYTNLQPLWAADNLTKKDDVILIKADPKFTKVIFRKIYPLNSKLKDLDQDIQNVISKNDPDLEIELTINEKRRGVYEAILFSNKPN